MEHFPTIESLANASEERVLRLWQGLGYYSRARNLHSTAKYIAFNLHGIFPSSYQDLIKLKGVGPYTAAAIASICFDEPVPVVDGNVYRFASRYFGLKQDISKSSTRKIFESTLFPEMAVDQPGTFNQALMEFGAILCSPSPHCEKCPLANGCYAYAKNEQGNLPVKSGKTKVRNRYFHYIVFCTEELILMKKRPEKDVWAGLFDFYLVEKECSGEKILEELKSSLNLNTESLILCEISEPMVHILSHQKISAIFYKIDISRSELKQIVQSSTLNPFSIEEVLNLPKPKLIVNYLQRIGIN